MKVKLINDQGQIINHELGWSGWMIFLPSCYTAYHRDWYMSVIFTLVATIMIIDRLVLNKAAAIVSIVFNLAKLAATVYFCLHYNRHHIKKLLDQGYQPASDEDATLLNATYAKYGFATTAYQGNTSVSSNPVINEDQAEIKSENNPFDDVTDQNTAPASQATDMTDQPIKPPYGIIAGIVVYQAVLSMVLANAFHFHP